MEWQNRSGPLVPFHRIFLLRFNAVRRPERNAPSQPQPRASLSSRFPHITELSEKHMRYFLGLVFGLLLGLQHVHACLTRDSWNILFFKAIPDPQPEADLIAIVSVSDDKKPRRGAAVMATATVIQVLKASDDRVRKGDKNCYATSEFKLRPSSFSISHG